MTLKKSIEITDEEINAIYSSGRREATTSFIKFLVEKINKLEDEIHHIKLQLLKDSHNSSKPPSTDPPDKKKSKSLRGKSGKKPGGQKGHKGSSLKRVQKPDKTKNIRPEGHCSCGKCLSKAKIIDHIIRQIFEITLPQKVVTEFIGEAVSCECGKIHKPNFPPGVTKEAQYGASIKSLVVYLKHYGFISYERIPGSPPSLLLQSIWPH